LGAWLLFLRRRLCFKRYDGLCRKEVNVKYQRNQHKLLIQRRNEKNIEKMEEESTDYAHIQNVSKL
jgi:hypothetical protein